MLFIIHTKQLVEAAEIKHFFISHYKIKADDVSLLEDYEETEQIITFSIAERPNVSEFKAGVWINMSEETSSMLNINIDLNIALPFASFFSFDVVIDDGSKDPYSWLLIKPDNTIFIADELPEYDTDKNFYLDHTSLK